MLKGGDLTAKEVAEMLQVHRGTVIGWHTDGKLKGEVIGRKLYIKAYHVRDFLLKRKDKAKVFFQLFQPLKEFQREIVNVKYFSQCFGKEISQ